MDKIKLMIYMHNPELMGDRDLPDVKELVEEYPFFQSARMLYVKNLRNQGYSNYGKALRETAVFVTNRTKLFFLLDERVIIKHDAEPTQKAAEEEVFDFARMAELAGFAKMPSAAEKSKDAASKLIETPVLPYFDNLSDTVDLDDFRRTFGKKSKTAATPQTKEERHAELLDNFKEVRISPSAPDENAEPEKDIVDLSVKSSTADAGLLETLANTFFKTGNYKQALNMYENLCLKYPEKNAYFAARIKEIKEIINNK